MADTMYPFAEGDSVISTECLISPPTKPSGVRVELPLACRGTIIEILNGIYTVAFEVGDGGIVETFCFSDQIARVQPSKPTPHQLPPMIVREPDRMIRAAYTSTPRYPHRWCRPVHALNFVLMSIVYVGIFVSNPIGVGIVTACFLVVSYIYDVSIHGNLHWYPRVLPHELEGDERFVVNHGRTAQAFLTDVLFAASVVVLLTWHFYYIPNPTIANAVLYVALCVVAFIAWAAKEIAHHRAVSMTIGNDG